MRKDVIVIVLSAVFATAGWPAPVEVNQSGANGAFQTIQEAIDSGADVITITDSAVYEENLEIGDPFDGGTAVTLTSNQTGDLRPVITPTEPKPYLEVHRADMDRGAGFGLFADNSIISNLIIEGNPDMDITSVGLGALFIMANNVVIENCLFRPRAGTERQINYPNSLVFVAQEGDHEVAVLNGRNGDGCIFRQCEFSGVATDADVEPTLDTAGYLTANENGQSATLCRMDHFTNGDDIIIAFEDCYFHHSYDAGVFPSNRGSGAGSLTLEFTRCRFDAFGKFAVRGRGSNLIVDQSVFTRTNQNRNGDGENSAVAIQTQDGHNCNATVTNCVFVNCGSANAQRGYYGGVHNHNAGEMIVDHCTFDLCLNGVTAGMGGGSDQTKVIVTNSIFHRIGYNAPPAVDAEGLPLEGSELLDENGLYPAWEWGVITNFSGNSIWSAAFNNAISEVAVINIENCLVGEIANEDDRIWGDVILDGLDVKDNVLGCRLYCGYEDGLVNGLDSVIRETPVFLNTDPDSDSPYQLDPDSPGQGLGAVFESTPVSNWELHE
ncbi:MAG: hypothetical protein JXR73_15425 [Candidatus Omnitrophica bacterium]|nr:hypothetical protein [Candidatus Omnitrophota bacterium]